MTNRDPEIYTFGDFQLNAHEPVLLHRGEAVPLQLKTLETLMALIRRPGQLITRDELIETVWPDSFVEENNLSQHIRSLRKYLTEDGSDAMIETVPRRGYRFLPEVRSNLAGCAENGSKPKSGDQLAYPRPTLIGRTAEIADIKDLLGGDTRLLTLTGVGGSGKTTLAKAVAYEFASYFPDGVHFVELGTVRNPDLVISVIAQTLGLKEGTSSAPIIETLKNYLRERQMLLIIDNFEQVLPAAPKLAELIQIAAGLKILVTSRAVLRLSSGQEFVVPPLELPELACSAPAELMDCESVRLFVERARQVRPAFSLSDGNAREVAQICTRLEGLPLAIELAAARVRIISPDLILRKLENRLNLLTGGSTDLPPRQRTIRGTVEWSYELLDEVERSLFRWLSVFSGGFTFEMAEKVLGVFIDQAGPGAEGPLRFSILDPLASLVDNSLLTSCEQPDGTMRFRMLEVMREYGHELLGQTSELSGLHRAHADCYLALAESAAPHLQGSGSIKWLNRLEEEHDNLRSAIRWSLENDPMTAARLSASLRFFWLFHTHIMEGHKWTKETYDRSHDLPPAIRAKLLNGLGVGARIKGDYDSAQVMHMEALYASMEAGDKRETAFSYRGLGAVAGRRGQLEAAQAFYETTLELSRELNDDSEVGYSLGSLGGLARIKGDFGNARRLLNESLSTFRQLGQKERVTTNLFALGVIAYQEQDYAAARALFSEAIPIAHELGDKIHISDLFDGMAALTVPFDPSLAAKISGAAAALRASIGYELAPAERLFRDSYVSRIETKLDRVTCHQLYREGAALNVQDVVELTRVPYPTRHSNLTHH
jgi:non-specific serine/threonine protein kinase